MDNDCEDEDSDEDLDDFEPDEDTSSKDEDLSDEEVELAGSLDGEFDAEYDASLYGGYGSSVNLGDLTEEQKDLYDDAHHAGHDTSENK